MRWEAGFRFAGTRFTPRSCRGPFGVAVQERSRHTGAPEGKPRKEETRGSGSGCATGSGDTSPPRLAQRVPRPAFSAGSVRTSQQRTCRSPTEKELSFRTFSSHLAGDAVTSGCLCSHRKRSRPPKATLLSPLAPSTVHGEDEINNDAGAAQKENSPAVKRGPQAIAAHLCQ